MAEDEFEGFARRDFLSFKEEKHQDPNFNGERKIVWRKMKNLKLHLDKELKRRGFPLEGKVSQYWINYTKRRVTGIWVAYTEIKPYYVVCQLNCGIYEDAVFAGIEINKKARDSLNRVADFISNNNDEFLSCLKKLDSRYGSIGYGNLQFESDKISASDLDLLSEVVRSEDAWFDIGESYPKVDNILTSADFVVRIADIFELLYPLYLVFVGRRPVGRGKIHKLLRVPDVRINKTTRSEKELAPTVSELSGDEIDDVIVAIDRRNKPGRVYRQHGRTETYRRSPVLSSALKRKYKDKCQICSDTFDVDRGFFCDAHHLKPLRAGGTDTSDNILVLCPNHHRIFHRCRIRIVSKGKSRTMIRAGEEILTVCG